MRSLAIASRSYRLTAFISRSNQGDSRIVHVAMSGAQEMTEAAFRGRSPSSAQRPVRQDARSVRVRQIGPDLLGELGERV